MSRSSTVNRRCPLLTWSPAFTYRSVTIPEIEQLRSTFSDSGSTRPTAATVFWDVLCGGGDGGTVGLWTGLFASAQVIAKLKLTIAMIGTVYRFILSSLAKVDFLRERQPWFQVLTCHFHFSVRHRWPVRLPYV